MACEGCKENAAALAAIQRDLWIANEQLARLLVHLEVPPAPDRDDGVMAVLEHWKPDA